MQKQQICDTQAYCRCTCSIFVMTALSYVLCVCVCGSMRISTLALLIQLKLSFQLSEVSKKLINKVRIEVGLLLNLHLAPQFRPHCSVQTAVFADIVCPSASKLVSVTKPSVRSLLFLRACSLNSFISPTHALYIKTLHKHTKIVN